MIDKDRMRTWTHTEGAGRSDSVEKIASCEVPCRTVYDGFKQIDGIIKGKVPMTVFMWVIGGLASLLIVLTSMLFTGQISIKDSLINVDKTVAVNTRQISIMIDESREMKRQVKKLVER